MKIFLTLLMAFMATNAIAMISPQGRSNQIKYDGSIDANSREQHFIKVQNKFGAVIDYGRAVIWDLTADNGMGVTQVLSGTGASPACIMAQVGGCASNAICLCQKYGYFAAASFDFNGSVPSVAGKRFFLSSTHIGSIAARVSENAYEPPGGIFYDAAVASGGVEIFIEK